MGFLCGFPMGARIVGELYEQHKLSREESALLLSFCNNIGPIYFLSYVVPTLGIDRPGRPFLLMYGIPLLYGFLLMRIRPWMTRKVSSCENHPEARSLQARQPGSCSLLAAIDASVLSGLTGIARLGGYMVFFNLLTIVFQPFQHVNTNILNIYRCLLEITSGIDCSGRSINFAILILLPFGGFSCIAQTYSMIRQTDLSLRPYLYHKAVQTAITAACYLLLYLHGLTP